MSIFKVEAPTLEYLNKAKEKINQELIKMDKKKLIAQLEFIQRLENSLDDLQTVIDELQNNN